MSQYIAIVQSGIDQLDKLISNAEYEISENNKKVDFYQMEINRLTGINTTFQASITDYQKKRVDAEALLTSLQ